MIVKCQYNVKAFCVLAYRGWARLGPPPHLNYPRIYGVFSGSITGLDFRVNHVLLSSKVKWGGDNNMGKSIFMNWAKTVSRNQKRQQRARAMMTAQAQNKLNQINFRLATLQNARSVSQILNNFDSIFLLSTQIKTLRSQYPGVVKIDNKTEDFLNQLPGKKDHILTNFVLHMIDINIEKAKSVERKTTKSSLLDKSRMAIAEAKHHIQDPIKLELLEAKMIEINSIT